MKNIILFHCFYILFFFIFLILYFNYQLNLFFRPDQLYDYEFDYILNDYCQNFSSTMTELEKYACNNKYKKSKFIWFSVDGLANDQLYYLLNQSRFKLPNFYYPNVHPFKITGSSYETFLTGQFNRNLNYSTIKKDNLINQMTDNAKMFVEYDGLKVPFGHFFANRKAFSIITQRTQEEKYPGLNFCNIGVDVYDENIQNEFQNYSDENGYLKDGHNKDEIFDYLNKYFEEKGFNYTLDECFKDRNITNNNSILFYSDIIDHLNHQYFKTHIFQYQNIFALETFMIQLFNWIDNNPEYALIFNSDHGGASFQGEDHLEPHGSNFDVKNFATFFVYTKELGDNYEKWNQKPKVINSFNCAPTIVQIINNINIPLLTEGVPEFLGDDEILRVAAIKSKEFQIKSLIYNYKRKYSNKLLNDVETKFNNSEFIKFDSLDNFTLDNSIKYIQFLNDTQKEITKQLLKKHSNFNTIFISLIFFLKSIFEGFIFFKSKLFKNEDKLSIYSHIIFLFLFNYDNLFLFIYPFNFLYDNIWWSKISLLFIIIIVTGFYLLIKKKKFLDKEFIIFYLLIFICILVNFFHHFNLFNKIFVFFFIMKFYQYSYLLLFLIIGILLTIWQFREFKNIYLFKKISILNLFIIISIIINFLLLLFNSQDFYFHKKIENYGKILKNIIYIFLIILIIFSIIPIKYEKKNNKIIIPNFIYFKFFYYFIFYFFAFDSEIFFYLFIITPILEYIIYYYNSLKEEKYLKILLILVIINFVDLFFFSTHKLLTIEVSTNYIKYKKIYKSSNFGNICNHFFEFKFFIIISFYILNCLKLNKNFNLTKISQFIIYILLIRFNILFLAFLKNYYSLGIENDFIYDFFNLLYCKGCEFFLFFGFFIIFMLLIFIIERLECSSCEIFDNNKKINLIEEDISSIVKGTEE